VDPSTRVDYAALPAGSLVGRYKVMSVLGHGGFGITYLARDTQLDRDVALKEYLPAAVAVRYAGNSVLPRSTEVADVFGWGRGRFIDEGRTLASLHEAPSVVRVFDFLEANRTAYIVMELLRGRTLEERVMEEGPLSPATIDAILWPLLAGLQQVHEAGFLHRDIKPANIMLGADDKATLIDFGASRAALANRTRTLTAIFTPGYAAPEQFGSTKQGPWTDIYCLAATLHYAITGRAPPSAVDRAMKDTYEPLADRQSLLFPSGLLAGIDAALSIQPEDRPQTIANWRILLQRRSPSDEVTVLMLRQPAAPRPPSRSARGGRIKMLSGVTALMLLAAGGFYGWSVLQPAAAPPPPPQVSGQGAAAVVEPPRSEAPRRAGEGEPRRKADASASQGQQAAAAEAQSRREAETRSISEEEARARAIPPPVAALDGTFGGNLSETGTTGRVLPITLQLAGTVLSGQIVYQRCAAVPVTLTVSSSGEISGNVRLPDVMACALTNASASGRVTAQGLQIELRGPGVVARGTMARKTPAVAVAATPAPPAVAPMTAPIDPRVFEGTYTGALNNSTPSGGQSGMR
jgi:serine/threonine protein kinase